jgi:hypothetical protein
MEIVIGHEADWTESGKIAIGHAAVRTNRRRAIQQTCAIYAPLHACTFRAVDVS